jgi:hypothetical protein
MKSFSQYIIEKSIHYFDWDDTLSKPSDSVRVHVKDSTGKVVHSLKTHEFNDHKLEPGHHYDFNDFKSTKKFSVKPIRKMVNRLKAIHKNGGKAEILTARSDFDDKHKFASKIKSGSGIDIRKVHVRRAGNLGLPAHEAKAKIISAAIKKHGYKSVHLYDDSKHNINSMLELKKHHPDVSFHGHHVEHNDDGSIKVTHYKA